ncbi:MAG: hypothetical protein L0H96_05195 [Humibacillus sp.]|nr:hypothetical protein [Humibacillus sp.]MDN5776283.1 hypothetical protein [Humibacillus sp.]
MEADALIDAVWDTALPAHPRAALHTLCSRLRARLGAEAIISTPAGYRLVVPENSCDSHQFESLRRHAANAPPAMAGDLLARALHLWQGAAYAEVADLPFATLEAQRLDSLRLDTTEQLAEILVHTDQPERAAALLEPLVRAHRLREHAVELLMTALHQAGRPASALEYYRDFQSLLVDELGLDPSPSLRDLQLHILRRQPVPAPLHDWVSVPEWLDLSGAFIDREKDLEDLVERVRSSRLVSVIGPGGVGKSRLVAEALPVLGHAMGIPITVVELAHIQTSESPDAVDKAVLESLNLQARDTTIRTAILEYLSISNHLIVLDNCEHVLDQVSGLAESLARRCTGVHVVITSRHRLGLPGEGIVRLLPLSMPSPEQSASRAEMTGSVRLFLDRVRRTRPTFNLDARSFTSVRDICIHLDGLPLALELGAARAAVLGVDVFARLMLDDPDTDPSLGSATDSGLDDVIAWSYRLLTETQQSLLCLVSILPPTFDPDTVRDLAAAACGGDTVNGLDEDLAELIEASLLASTDVGGGVQLRLLSVVRDFARRELRDADMEDHAQKALAISTSRFVAQVARDTLGPDCAEALGRLATHRAAVAQSLRWSLDSGHLELAQQIAGPLELCAHWTPDIELSDLIVSAAERSVDAPGQSANLAVAAGGTALAMRGDASRARRLAALALDRADSAEARFLGMLGLAVAATYEGDYTEATRWWKQIASLEGLTKGMTALGHTSLALLACFTDDIATARRESEFAELATEATGAAAQHAFAVYASGETALREDASLALPVLRRAVDAADRAGAAHVSNVSRVALLSALVRLEQSQEAWAIAGPLLEQERRVGVWPQIWTTLRILTELLAIRDQPQDALLLLGAIDAAESSPPVQGADRQRYQRLSNQLTKKLGEKRATDIQILARSLTRTQVLDRALAQLPNP